MLTAVRHEIITRWVITYNIPLRRGRATIVAVEINKYYIFWLCVCSLRYPSCNVHAPYCHLWRARLYDIVSHFLINGTVFEKKKLLNIKFVCWFSLRLLSETFLILRRSELDVIKNAYRSSFEVPIILVEFKETWIFWVDFRKIFRRILPVGVELFHAYRRQTWQS